MNHFTRRMGRIVGGLRRRKTYEVFSYNCNSIRNVFFFFVLCQRGSFVFEKKGFPLYFFINFFFFNY